MNVKGFKLQIASHPDGSISIEISDFSTEIPDFSASASVSVSVTAKSWQEVINKSQAVVDAAKRGLIVKTDVFMEHPPEQGDKN